MGRLIDADALIKALNLAEWFNIADFNKAVYTVRKAQPVDAVPVSWIKEQAKKRDKAVASILMLTVQEWKDETD